jgi:hypothetical protein
MPLTEEPFYPFVFSMSVYGYREYTAGPRGVTGNFLSVSGDFRICGKLDGLGSNQILGKLDGSRRGREESARSNGIIGK